MDLLGFDRFGLVKELLSNRNRLVWCLRRARAQSDEERLAIEVRFAVIRLFDCYQVSETCSNDAACLAVSPCEGRFKVLLESKPG